VVVVTHEVAHVLEDLALLDPLWSVKHDCRVDLVDFLWFHEFKGEIGDPLVLEYGPFIGDLDIGDMQVLIRHIYHLINPFMRVLTLPIIHRQHKNKPSFHQRDLILQKDLPQRFPCFIDNKNIVLGLDQIQTKSLMHSARGDPLAVDFGGGD